MSSSNDELYIKSLDQANIHFASHFFDANNIQNLKPGGLVKAKYETKQEWEAKKPICIILRREHDNGLGMVDNHYYYLVYRKKPFYSWMDSMNLPRKYDRTAGFYLPFVILKHMDDNHLKYLSELVLVLGDGRIFTASCESLFDFFIKNRMGTVTNFNQLVTGIPMEIMRELK